MMLGSPMKICAYHGTLKKNVESIQRDGFKISKGEHQWFGDGIYFFEALKTISDGFEEVKNWVIYVKHCKDWAVFEVCIESDNFIALVGCEDDKKLFKQIRKEAKELHDRSKRRNELFIEQLIYHLLRCKLNIDFIRVLVNADKYGRFISESYTNVHPQVQICVVNDDCIKEVTLCQGGT